MYLRRETTAFGGSGPVKGAEQSDVSEVVQGADPTTFGADSVPLPLLESLISALKSRRMGAIHGRDVLVVRARRHPDWEHIESNPPSMGHACGGSLGPCSGAGVAV